MVVFPERDMGERVARWLVSKNIIDHINLSPDYSLVELSTPPGMVGSTLADSKLWHKFGVTLLAIRRDKDILISPDPQITLKHDDILIVIGRNESLKLLDNE